MKNKKYNLINKAKNKIIDFAWSLNNSTQLDESDINDLINSCKGRILKKYVKHVLRCGEFHNNKFYMPSTRVCMASKVKKKPLRFTYEE